MAARREEEQQRMGWGGAKKEAESNVWEKEKRKQRDKEAVC